MLKCSSNAVSLRRSALVPCPLASALACRRRRRLLSSLARQRPLACRRRRHLLSSLARQGPPSPAVVVAACSRPLPVSVPSPAVVVAACSRPLPVRVRPRLPSSLPRALVPCPSTSALACRCRRHQAVFTTAAAANNLVLFG